MLHIEMYLSVSVMQLTNCALIFPPVSGMLALALDDFTLLVVDIETRRVVRKFAGHHGKINDMVG